MGIFSNLFRKNKEERAVGTSLYFNTSSSYTTDKAMLLSTVYRCVDVISDSVAQLPLEPYLIDTQGFKQKHLNHATYYMLNKEPNHKMSRFTFIKTLVVSMLLKGNAYAVINRNRKGDEISLEFIPSELVTIDRKSVV